MKILLISPYFRPMVGGVETHLDDLCKYLDHKGHEVFVRTYKAFGVKNRGKSKERNGKINIQRLWWPDFNLIFKLEKYPQLKFIYIFTGLFIDCFLFLLRNNKSVDVIQAHGFIAAAIGAILGKVFRKRVVINTHVGFNLSENLMTKIIKWVLFSSDKILVLTKGVKKSLESIGIPENKIDVYHYWVNSKIFNFQKDAKKKLGWRSKFVVLFVGRLIEVKGVSIIFDLAKKLKDLTFAIAGSGPLSTDLENKSKNFTNIIFLGKVKNEDLPNYYSGADVLLIPSKLIKQEYQEGIPRVMIEALSCGLPVITTSAGGIPDVFSQEIGFMVDDNPEDLSQVINKMYTDKKYLINTAKNSRVFALRVFGIKNAEIIESSLIEDID